MNFRKQEPPFTIKIELTEGCNLRCTFCGMNGIRGPLKEDNRFKFMTVETATEIASQIADAGWRSKLEHTLRGEPSLNPNRDAIIAAERDMLPNSQIMMTSNGGGFLGKPGIKQNLLSIFDAGLNVLALDDYEGVNIVPKIMEVVCDPNTKDIRQPWVQEAGIDVFFYPEQKAGNPYKRHKPSYRMITFIKDLPTATTDTHNARNNVSNHCGAGAPPNDRMAGKRCARPFREIAIRQDGQLMLCCNDWRGVYKIGSTEGNHIEDLWQSPAFAAARVKMYHGERDFGPCQGCDSKSWRTGLLPDPMGRAMVGPVTPAINKIVREASAGKPMTKPVIREWEE